MYYNLRWILFFSTCACISSTVTTTSEESRVYEPLSAEALLCIHDAIMLTPNMNRAKVDKVLFAFGRYNYDISAVQGISGAHDLLNFGLREKHTNLTQSQWNAALNETRLIRNIFKMSNENTAPEFIDAVADIVDLEQKANVKKIFKELPINDDDRLSARWYLFSMAVKNALATDPAPFHALLHRDPNNTFCSNETSTEERLPTHRKWFNLTEADIYFKCFVVSKRASLVNVDKVKHYIKLLVKVNFHNPPFATEAQSDAVLELLYTTYVQYECDLTLSEWKSMFGTGKKDEVINIFADGNLSKAYLTTYKERLENFLSFEVTGKVIKILTAISKCDKDEDEFKTVTSGFVQDAENVVNNLAFCSEVDEKIPYGDRDGYCLNKKSYCSGDTDESSIFYAAKYCENFVA